MTLKNLELANYITDPETLYASLCQKYDKAASVIIMMRCAAYFIGNLTDAERERFGIVSDPQLIARKHAELMTRAIRRRKEESQELKRANAPVSQDF